MFPKHKKKTTQSRLSAKSSQITDD